MVISASASLCMELLIENAGQLVTHKQFYDYVWRRFGTEPGATALYQNISALRRALNKAGLQENIIRTMPRKGFILSPKTTVQYEDASPPAIRCVPESVHTVLEELNETADQDLNEERGQTAQNEQIPGVKPARFLWLFPVGRHSLATCLKTKKIFLMLVSLTFLTALLIYFFYTATGLSYDDPVFMYSTDDKGCKIFNNSDAPLSKEEVKKEVDALDTDCKNTPYVYLTAFKHADSFSYFNCEHSLTGSIRANCRSHYYVKNLNND